MTLEEARKVLAALEREGVRYVLIGSMAMAVHGVIRATRDMGFFVDPSAENVARLRAALASVYVDPSIEDISAEDLGGGERYRFEDIESQSVDFDGIAVRVATPHMLYRMKRDTVRPQDKLDAAQLRQAFDLEDD